MAKRNKWAQRYPVTSVRSYVRAATGRELDEITKETGWGFKYFEAVKQALLEAKHSMRHVTVVADYDVDGVSSADIMYSLLKEMGIKMSIIMPKRFSEGYGLSDKILDRIPDGELLITIDNGITCVEQIKKARERGMFVIVLDHHQAGETLPEADILIDPSAIGEADFTKYCGAGIGYRLACYILGENHPLIKRLSVVAMFGTIADCMELSGDNRVIVTEGLNNLKNGNCVPAVKELCEKCKITKGSTATDIAFNVAPALNAPGRLHDDGAQKAMSALVLGGEHIDSIIEDNTTRKNIVNTITESLDFEALKNSDDKCIVLRNDDVPRGIVGIIAGKISESTGKPSIVLTLDKDTGELNGSARSPREDFSLVETLRAHEDLLVRVGGHAKAAGLALVPENVDALRKALNEDIPKGQAKDDAIYWDLQLNDLNFLTVSKQILSLEPTGEGLPAPIVRIKTRLKPDSMHLFGEVDTGEVNERGEKIVKPKHVRFNCGNFTAVAFNDADWVNEQLRSVPRPHYVDIVGRLNENIYYNERLKKEVRTLQIICDDFELT